MIKCYVGQSLIKFECDNQQEVHTLCHTLDIYPHEKIWKVSNEAEKLIFLEEVRGIDGVNFIYVGDRTILGTNEWEQDKGYEPRKNLFY